MYDSSISIVGGGPSGCSTGIFLAKKGFDNITIYEKSPNKRKACAGGLSWRVIKRYKEFLRNVPMNPIKHCKFEFDGIKFEFMFKRPVVYVTDRLIFDKNLMEVAKSQGIKFVYRQADIKKLKSNVLIDARGFVKAERVGTSISAICKVKNPVFTAIFNRKINPLGYFWIFPLSEDKANVGIVGLSNRWGMPLAKAFQMFTKKYELKIVDMGAAPISVDCGDTELGYRRGQGIVLKVGEAGNLVNPITGEGIYYGMKSGELAAEALLRDDPIESYMQLIEKNILKEFHVWEGIYKLLFFLPPVIGVNIFKLCLNLFNRIEL